MKQTLPVLAEQFEVDQVTLDLFSAEGAPSPVDPPAEHLSVRSRRRVIQAILKARFSVGAFEVIRRRNAAYWASPRSTAARVTYGEAMREKQRLSKAPDAQLVAEAGAIGFFA